MARVKNALFMESTAVALSETSGSFDMEEYGLANFTAKITGNNASDKTFDTGTMEVQTFTFPSKASAANGDYVKFFDQAGTAWAVALTKPVAEVDTLTVPALVVGAADGDVAILTDGSGLTWGFYFDTTGGNSVPPTSAAYIAIPSGRKTRVDISLAVDNTGIVTACKSALNALTGFTAAITLSGTTTLIATMAVKAPCTDPLVKAFDGVAAATSFSGVETTAGVAAQTPTGAIWTAIASGNKCLADISGDTTAAQVAARVETAVDAMTGLTAVIVTDDSANNGTMLFTQVVPGPTSDSVPKSYNDGGAGSITIANTTQGVATEVDITNNRVYIPSHGYLTGMKITALTTTTTLPTGVTTSTVYYVIYDTVDYIKFATSQANALAGTAIDLTDYGVTLGVHTISVATSLAGSVKLQVNIEPSTGTANYVDVSDEEIVNGNNSQSFSGATTLRWVLADVAPADFRAIVTVTSGTILAECRGFAKAFK